MHLGRMGRMWCAASRFRYSVRYIGRLVVGYDKVGIGIVVTQTLKYHFMEGSPVIADQVQHTHIGCRRQIEK